MDKVGQHPGSCVVNLFPLPTAPNFIRHMSIRLTAPLGFMRPRCPSGGYAPDAIRNRNRNRSDLKERNMNTDALLNHREKSFHGGVAETFFEVGLRALPRVLLVYTSYFSSTLRHVPHGSSDGEQSPFVNYTLLPHPTLHLQIVGGFGKNLERQPFLDPASQE